MKLTQNKKALLAIKILGLGLLGAGIYITWYLLTMPHNCYQAVLMTKDLVNKQTKTLETGYLDPTLNKQVEAAFEKQSELCSSK